MIAGEVLRNSPRRQVTIGPVSISPLVGLARTVQPAHASSGKLRVGGLRNPAEVACRVVYAATTPSLRVRNALLERLANLLTGAHAEIGGKGFHLRLQFGGEFHGQHDGIR